ncbi:MAG: type II CRISPR-associated endonuclease Cas1 [Phycisphaeraceae bacterium]|nr:type II CRISPR-associated endonuclease Cas1 [Phycisphaeraceae bacterium]
MIKRTIEISRQPAHLSVRNDQLVIQPLDQPKSVATTIPCEDIGVVLVDQPQVNYSHPALATLMRYGAAVVICGHDHLPAGLLLPLSDHTEVVWRVHDQINASEPTKKRLWQQIITAKILRQAGNLPQGSPARGFLENLARDVKSGDTTNAEAHAARIYWSAWLDPEGISNLVSSVTAQSGPIALDPDAFRRDPDGLDPVNVMLNYGYAVLRAAVARALVAAGLFPALGLHHCNRANAFVLADDLVEPLRPLVDARVRDLFLAGRGIQDGLDQSTKAALLSLLTHTVILAPGDGSASPLMVALHRVTASLVRCLRGEENRLALPAWDQSKLWT